MKYSSILVKRAITLSFFTIVYNIIEGVISIFFGLTGGSISLAGFGGDSFIEVGSALLGNLELVMFWLLIVSDDLPLELEYYFYYCQE